MSMIKEDIINKWKDAYKAKDSTLKSAYESVKAKILTEEKSGKHQLPLSDDIVTNIILKEVKELKETQSYYSTEDAEYHEIEKKITILSEYLPKQLTSEEVKKIIERLLSVETNKGKLIGLTVKEVGTRYEKSKISALVEEVMNCKDVRN